jgi:hypothetical protein
MTDRTEQVLFTSGKLGQEYGSVCQNGKFQLKMIAQGCTMTGSEIYGKNLELGISSHV